jgi:hypothetical protein
MMQVSQNEIWEAAISVPSAIQTLRRKLDLPASDREVYLAYSSTTTSQFAGYLVTEKTSIDRLTAFCPVSSDLCVASAAWLREVSRQFNIAVRLIQVPRARCNSAEVIWLDQLILAGREVPSWIYSLACVPITLPWDGSYVYPRPFCPKMFESLAKQPQAAVWMREQLARSGGQHEMSLHGTITA